MRKLEINTSGTRDLVGSLSAAVICLVLASCSQNTASNPFPGGLAPTLVLTPFPTGQAGPTMAVAVPDFAALIPPAPPGFGIDANHIIFYSNISGDYELFQMDIQGADKNALAGSPIYDLEPAWSLDGKFVAFVSDHTDGIQQVFLLDTVSGHISQLTHLEADSWTPAWSPDSRSLSFSSTASGDSEVYRLDLSSGLQNSGPQNLTNSPASDETLPVWSPDGSRIAYVSNQFGDLDVMLMDPVGSETTRLTEFEGMDTVPAWSPDGSRIAYVSFQEENFDIYAIGLQDRQPVRLTEHPAYEWSPAWSPDGGRIAFASTREHVETYDVYIMNADGSGQTRLTSEPANDILPVWWP